MRLPLRAGAASVAAVLVLVLGGCGSGSGGSGSATDTGSAGGPNSSGAGPASIPSQQLPAPPGSSGPAPAESSGPASAESSGSAPAGTQSNAASASSGAAPAESSGPAPADSQDSGHGLAVADLDYDWTGEPVSGPSTALPDGEYRCYVSNAPADASLTWIGNLEASGSDLELNGNPGSIEYSDTTDVHISGAGMDSAQRTVVVQESDGTIALWVRFAEQTARCAP